MAPKFPDKKKTLFLVFGELKVRKLNLRQIDFLLKVTTNYALNTTNNALITDFCLKY